MEEKHIEISQDLATSLGISSPIKSIGFNGIFLGFDRPPVGLSIGFDWILIGSSADPRMRPCTHGRKAH
jgi:hypothetical protein